MESRISMFFAPRVPAWVAAVLLAGISIGLQDIAAQAPDLAQVRGREPSEIFARVELVRSELELIRREMGKPKNRQPEIGVKNAAPREVFFQALTLARKTDRFCFEQIRERGKIPPTPRGDIHPGHVFVVVDGTLERLRRVKQKLKILEASEEPPPDVTKTPSDVFRAIVQANRQLNLLLDRQFSPSDVYQQVTQAVSYASRLLAEFDGTTRIPKAPPLERGKVPQDVYRRLVACFERIRRIATHAGYSMLELKPSAEGIDGVTPSDVYDIASLLVSELAFLHAQLDSSATVREAYYPGRKFPSHVYQRAGILEAQLIELEDRVGKDPGRLRRKGAKR